MKRPQSFQIEQGSQDQNWFEYTQTEVESASAKWIQAPLKLPPDPLDTSLLNPEEGGFSGNL